MVARFVAGRVSRDERGGGISRDPLVAVDRYGLRPKTSFPPVSSTALARGPPAGYKRRRSELNREGELATPSSSPTKIPR